MALCQNIAVVMVDKYPRHRLAAGHQTLEDGGRAITIAHPELCLGELISVFTAT